MSYVACKCPKCGWVHSAIPLSDAEAQVAFVNEYSKSKGLPQTASIDHYRRCSRCGAPTDDFVPACPRDAPMACTIEGVVVPGVSP